VSEFDLVRTGYTAVGKEHEFFLEKIYSQWGIQHLTMGAHMYQ
jgi:hypothetical protein